MFDIILAIALLILAVPMTARQLVYYSTFNLFERINNAWDRESGGPFHINLLFTLIALLLGFLVQLFTLCFTAFAWYKSIQILIRYGII